MTQILKPLKHGNVLTEEEALKDIESAPRKEDPQVSDQYEGLGIDYGLIYFNKGREIRGLWVSKDGRSAEKINDNYLLPMLYHDYNLYFGFRDALHKFGDKRVQTYEDTVSCITTHNGQAVVAVDNHGFFDTTGNKLLECKARFRGLASAGGKLFYSNPEDKVFSADSRRLGQMYCNGELTSLDDVLLIPGYNNIYRYDGNKAESICNINQPKGTAAVAEKEGLVIYAGRDSGISIILPNEERTLILKKEAKRSTSIVTAPIDFIDHLVRNRQK